MKLYTEEQVKKLLDKMSLVTERKNLGISANLRHRIIEIGNLIKSETPIELPSDEEITDKALEVGYTNNLFTLGAKWMRDKIQGDSK